MRRFSLAIYTILLVLFFVLQFSFLTKRTQSFNFGDENEHLTPAFMMIKESKSLYQDLSTNHQPLPIFTAYFFYKIVPVANLFMLIERVRQSLFLLSFIGAALLTLRFGLRGLIASIFIELIKFYFFGYHLLAETLVVYPLMYITGVLFESVFSKTQMTKTSIVNRIDDCVYALSIFWIAFNLLPTWPFLVLFSIFYFRSKTLKKIFLPGFLWFLIVPTVLLFTVVKPFFWFQETVVNNYRYFLPYETSLTARDIFYLLAYPFLSVLSIHQPIARYYALLLFLGIISNVVLMFKKGKIGNSIKYNLLFFYPLLILLNTRVTSSDVGFYTAFHILPQVAFLTMVVVFTVFLAFKSFSCKTARWVFTVIMVISGVALLVNGTKWWRESVSFDKFNEHFIQYGEDESIGMAIAAIKKKGDTLLAGTQSSFINIFADIPLATRQTAYLAWAYRSPTLRNEFNSILEKSPPTFVYFPESNNPYYLALIPILKEKYTRIQRSFGGNTNLYFLSSEIGNRTPEQWKRFLDLLYKPPID